MGMLFRFVLIFLLATLVLRALRRVLAGVFEGAGQADRGRRGGPPERGVQMVRDPVCGTFLPPSNALSLASRGGVEYFCSEKCRDAYKARA